MRNPEEAAQRAARHAALGEPLRLAIVDELTATDRAVVELRRSLGIESNLLAHHLDTLEAVGIVARFRSSGDGRRRYVHLIHEALDGLVPNRGVRPGRALFVCTKNSARSQLAAALWRSMANAPADSAGTRPAHEVHPGARAAAQRAGLDLADTSPRHLDDLSVTPDLAVTVCDQAHEALRPDDAWLHWSVPDPVDDGSMAAFDAALDDLRQRIGRVLESSTPR